MQKLEEILKAEEAARHAVAAAREQARSEVRDAEATAVEIRAEERVRTAQQAATIESDLLDSARREAEDVAMKATANLEGLISQARSKVTVVVDNVVNELAG